jgi:phosphoserine phosphatase
VLWYKALAAELESGDHAVFDADDTLWNGDLGEALQEALVRDGRLDQAVDDRYRELLRADRRTAYAYATTALAGLTETFLRERTAALWAESWAQRVFPEMRGLLAALAARGVTAWVASATNRWAIEVAASALGIPTERVIAMEVEADGGVLTDRLLLPAVSGAGKAEAIERRLPRVPALVAGDSVNDLAMLRLATKVALVVNAKPGEDPLTGVDLLGEAALCGWWVRDLF